MIKAKGTGTLEKTRTFDYATRFIYYLLILLPAALGFLYIRAFGVSVVQRDVWSMVPILDRWSAGTLQVSDSFVQHFEHRSTFPEVAMLLLGIATEYDNVIGGVVDDDLSPPQRFQQIGIDSKKGGEGVCGVTMDSGGAGL